MEAKEAELTRTNTETNRLRQALDAMEGDIEQRATELAGKTTALAEAQAQLDVAEQSVQSLQQELVSAQQAVETMTTQLSDSADIEARLSAAQLEVQELRTMVDGLEIGKAELEALEFGARQERDQARTGRDELQSRITTVEEQLAVAEEGYR